MPTDTPEPPPLTNALGGSASRYLRQHAHQPVAWQPWSEEAFRFARERDVPVLVSIGYSACHWCHVMAHECFDDPNIASELNEHFLSIKVDREEHPDVDAFYMDAVQRLTGHGGWPLNAFCTPDGSPFFVGTYFPPHRMHDRPSFPEVLATIRGWWTERRLDVEKQANSLREAFITDLPPLYIRPDHSPSELSRTLSQVEDALRASFDTEHGGFGPAPKFPPGMLLTTLAQWHALAGESPGWEMTTTTLDALARGGVRDMINGGFARYSVDDTWTVPHFEKMLYDQATLLRAYAWAHAADPNRGYDEVCNEIIEYIERDLLLDNGLLASSHDADTPAGEGRAACWSRIELIDALGQIDGDRVADYFQVEGPPTFRDPHTGFESWVLHRSPDDEALLGWDELRSRLRTTAQKRPQPGRDEKAVLSWNAMAIRALSEAGAILDRPDVRSLARAIAETAWQVFQESSAWYRIVHRSTATIPALAEDLAAFAWAAVVLGDDDPSWFVRAKALIETCWEQFGNRDEIGVRSGRDGIVPVRAEVYDNATPSANSMLAAATMQYAYATGDALMLTRAQELVRSLRPVACAHPLAFGLLLEGITWLDAQSIQIVITGGSDFQRDARASLQRTSVGPLVTILSGRPEAVQQFPLGHEHESETIAICEDGVCQLPIRDPSEAAAYLEMALTRRKATCSG